LAGSLELRFQQPLKDPFFRSYEIYSFLESACLEQRHGGSRRAVADFCWRRAFASIWLNDLQAGVGRRVPLTLRSRPMETAALAFLFSCRVLELCPNGARLACSVRQAKLSDTLARGNSAVCALGTLAESENLGPIKRRGISQIAWFDALVPLPLNGLRLGTSCLRKCVILVRSETGCMRSFESGSTASR